MIEWKPIIGFEDYKVSSQGIVKSKTGYIVRQQKCNGRKQVNLAKAIDGKRVYRMCYVDMIVLLAFKDIPYAYPRLEPVHINGDLSDNLVGNLTWKKVNTVFSKPLKEYGIYLHLDGEDYLVKSVTTYKDIQTQIGLHFTNVTKFLDTDKIYVSPINHNSYKIKTLDYDNI